MRPFLFPSRGLGMIVEGAVQSHHSSLRGPGARGDECRVPRALKLGGTMRRLVTVLLVDAVSWFSTDAKADVLSACACDPLSASCVIPGASDPGDSAAATAAGARLVGCAN